MSTRSVIFRLLSCTALASIPFSAIAQTAATAAPAPAATPGAKLTTPVQASEEATKEAVMSMNANDVPGALAHLSEALRLNPRNSGAYVLRAAIYCQDKKWPQAEEDFKAAQAIAPNNSVIKFNLVQLKFLQKQYDAAKIDFVALEKDPDMGDLAAYKAFLCDLFGSHVDVAKQELDVFDKVDGNPSYFFSNAAWSLVHKDNDGARDWLLSASRIYPPEKNAMYAQSLRDLGYLPLPAPTSP